MRRIHDQARGHLVPLADVAAQIARRSPRLGATRLVAVDGPGGSGKSTLARRLARELGDATVIETDDFSSWDVPLGWWDRFETDVLAPIAAGQPRIRYRRHDWIADRLGDWREHGIGAVTIVEGVSSSRAAVADRLSYALWVDAPPEVRLARGLERDGEAWRAHWASWMAAEDAFFAADAARGRADLVVDAYPSVPHDPDREIVVLAPAG